MRQLAVVTTYGSVRDGRPIATFALNDNDSVELEVTPISVQRDVEHRLGADECLHVGAHGVSVIGPGGERPLTSDAAVLATAARKDRVAVVERDLELSPDSVRFVGWWSL